MILNPRKRKVVRFTRARAKDPLSYSLADTLIPEASSCKYLGIILRCDLIWADPVNYSLKKALNALNFTMRILKEENNNTKTFTYMSLVRPILEYGVRVLGSVQGGTNNCVRQGAKESGQICISYEQFELGKYGVA
jgi:hypothetical protein